MCENNGMVEHGVEQHEELLPLQFSSHVTVLVLIPSRQRNEKIKSFQINNSKEEISDRNNMKNLYIFNH